VTVMACGAWWSPISSSLILNLKAACRVIPLLRCCPTLPRLIPQNTKKPEPEASEWSFSVAASW